MAVKNYRKLPGHGSSLVASCALYLGDDHLLKVSTGGGAEEYRRFYYADIQAVLIRRTAFYVWTLSVAAFTAAAFMIPGLLVSARPGGWVNAIALYIPGGLAALVFLVNLILGPTCSTVLQTAAHKEKIPSLRRTRTAAKTIKRLTPFIEAAQAGIPLSEIPPDGGAPAAGSSLPGPPAAPASDSSLPTEHQAVNENS